MRNSDLSGGKREKLDGPNVPAFRRPATHGLFRIAIGLGLALAVGFAITIFAGGHPLLGPLTPRDSERAELVSGPEPDADVSVRKAQQSAQQALDEANALSAEAESQTRRQLLEAEQQIARIRAAAGAGSEDAFIEAERVIAKAHEQLDEASRED